jgi:ABC-type glycerol-3-phosphate transport system permease component
MNLETTHRWNRQVQLALSVVRRLVLNVVLLALSVLALLPLWWMVIGGFKPLSDLFAFPPRLWPSRWILDGYKKLFYYFPFLRNFWNSVWMSSVSTFGALFSTSIAAFAFARMRFRGKDMLFAAMLSTMMIPSIIFMIPRFIMFKTVGWVNTPLPLVVPSFFASAQFVFMLRQFFHTLPGELEEAAQIDGASWPRIYFSISLPLIKPALVTMGLFTFRSSWNSLLGPIIYLNSLEQLNLTAAAAYLRTVFDSGENMSAQMAMATLTVVPLLALFVFAQRYIVRGMVFSGLKF